MLVHLNLLAITLNLQFNVSLFLTMRIARGLLLLYPDQYNWHSRHLQLDLNTSFFKF